MRDDTHRNTSPRIIFEFKPLLLLLLPRLSPIISKIKMTTRVSKENFTRPMLYARINDVLHNTDESSSVVACLATKFKGFVFFYDSSPTFALFPRFWLSRLMTAKLCVSVCAFVCPFRASSTDTEDIQRISAAQRFLRATFLSATS